MGTHLNQSHTTSPFPSPYPQHRKSEGFPYRQIASHMFIYMLTEDMYHKYETPSFHIY